MIYKHGTYGEQIPTQDKLPLSGMGTIPVYIGTAPVETLSNYTIAVNTPIMVNSFEEAKTKLGYSDDWKKYTLCEAMYAHFKNKVGSIGPIILINVLNPEVHKAEVPVEKTHIIGGIDANGKRTGIACVDLVYQTLGVIPSVLAAPGWSHIPDVEKALVEKCKKINGHWDAICVTDLDSSNAKTIEGAKAWKETNGYKSKEEKICWPRVINNDKEFFMSTMVVVRMQQTDCANDDTPFESPSNKPIDITGTILGDGTAISFDEVQANELNSKGITTAAYRSGNWVLWGPHNANYEFGKEDIDARDKFDCGIRMMMYLTNLFQKRYMSSVDSPLNRAMVDTILNDSQIWLNSLVADGKLLFAQITFNEASNSVNSIVEGDFVFDVRTTTTPAGKSLSFKLQYTNQGINTLFGGEN